MSYDADASCCRIVTDIRNGNWLATTSERNNNHVNTSDRRRRCSGARGRKGGKLCFPPFHCFFHCFFRIFFNSFFSSFIRLFGDLRRCCATTAPKSKTPSHHISASASAHPHRPINQPTTTTRIVPVQHVPIWSYVIHSHAVSQTTTPHDPDHDDHTLAHDRGKRRELGGLGLCAARGGGGSYDRTLNFAALCKNKRKNGCGKRGAVGRRSS